uniref:Uncharacterized protein n=1 Tax=Rhizophora mucronata TaxID=61149 RepID=A0A2P2P9D3_RHIMU
MPKFHCCLLNCRARRHSTTTCLLTHQKFPHFSLFSFLMILENK